MLRLRDLTCAGASLVLVAGFAYVAIKAERELESCRDALASKPATDYKQKLHEMNVKLAHEQDEKARCKVLDWTQSIIDKKFAEGCNTVYGDYEVEGYKVGRSMSKKP